MHERESDPWNHPDNIRERVRRTAASTTPPPLPVDWFIPHHQPRALPRSARKRRARPAAVTIFVILVGLALISSLCGLSLLTYDGEYCIEFSYRQECGTFGELLESLTLVPPSVWIGGLSAAIVYQTLTIYGVWTMRRWGWWLAVGGLLFNFWWSMCDMGIRVFVIWTVSGILLLWFARNKHLFTRARHRSPF